MLFIGSDLPDLSAAHLHDAAASSAAGHDVIGPAEDGGYWTLGLTAPADRLFEDIPWSTDRVLSLTLQRFHEVGRKPVILPTLADCDTPDDLARWPGLIAR